jgi:hypothetical protein
MFTPPLTTLPLTFAGASALPVIDNQPMVCPSLNAAARTDGQSASDIANAADRSKERGLNLDIKT